MHTWQLQIVLEIVFLTLVYLHLSKKNAGAIVAYALQSLAMVVILFNAYLGTGNLALLGLTVMTFLVKVVMAPVFFTQLVRKNALKFSVSTYLNTPLTLIVIAALTGIAQSQKFSPLTSIIPGNHDLLVLCVAVMLLSVFLIVNRKGALSQLIGILSFENSIFAFATFAGLEQSFGLQLGIMFNICVWFSIATVFVSMIYTHFGTLNVTSMKQLID